MSDLPWDSAKVWFDLELNGTLPDVHAPDTTAADWRTLVNLVRSLGWQFEYLIDDEPQPLPAAVQDMLRLRDEAGAQLNVRPTPGILAIFRPYGSQW